jgi:hypothetical protein
VQSHSFYRVLLGIQQEKPGIKEDNTGQQENQGPFKYSPENLPNGRNQEQEQTTCHHYTEQSTGKQEAGNQQGGQ